MSGNPTPDGTRSLHDRKVMAPLKLKAFQFGIAFQQSLHDRKVMAPLKLWAWGCGVPRRRALHDRKVMAPLKLRPQVDGLQQVGLSMTARSWPH